MNCKKIIVVLTCMFATVLAFSEQIYEHEGSVKANKQLIKKITTLLQNGQFEKVRTVLTSVPVCPNGTISEQDIPAYCTEEKLGGKAENLHYMYNTYAGHEWVHLVTVKSDKEAGFIKPNHPLNTVNCAYVLDEALKANYKNITGREKTDMSRENKGAYAKFYNRYKDTWLKNFVQEWLLYSPERGCSVGEVAFRNLFLHVVILEDGSEEEWRPHLSNTGINDRYYWSYYGEFWDGFANIAHRLNEDEMVERVKAAEYTDWLNPSRLYHKKTDSPSDPIRRFIISWGDRDDYMWRTFAVKPPTEQMKKNAQEMYNLCVKNYKDARRHCVNFGSHARKHGIVLKGFEDKNIVQNVQKGLRHPRTDASGTIWPSR